MRMSISRTKMLQVSKCLIGLAVMVLQSCDITDNRRDLLCGNWESVEGKPDVLIYKEGEASFVDESYCKGALHNESLNLFWFAVTSTDKVTLLGVNTNTKSPTFCGLPSRA